MKIGIVLYPTFGGSGIVATELGKALSRKNHQVHFITYSQPVKLDVLRENIFYHEVSTSDYPLFEFTPYEQVLTSKLVDVVKFEKIYLPKNFLNFFINKLANSILCKTIILSAFFGNKNLSAKILTKCFYPSTLRRCF